MTLLLFLVDIFDRASPLLFLLIRNFFKKGYLGNGKKITKPNVIIPVSLRGAKKIPSLVIASPLGAKQSLTKTLRLPRRSAPRNDNLLVEIAASLRSSQ
jgi:hypothetical protein